jgi:phosphoribosylformylglycinamidine synthase
MVRAFELAGADAQTVHLDRLVAEPDRLDEFDLVAFPGGFSYGDDIASGRIFAMRARERLYPALRRAVERGCPMIGACNGFQVMVQIGLLPGPRAGETWPEDRAPAQTVALTENAGARFVDRWVGMKGRAGKHVRMDPGAGAS